MLLPEADRIRGIELSQIRQIVDHAPKDAISLALGEIRLPLPQVLRDKALEIMQTLNPVYTPNAGLPELRQQIADYYQGLCSADQVCVTNGAEEAIYCVLSALVNQGDRIAIPDPDYTANPAIARIMQADLVILPFNEDFRTIDWNLWDEILGHKVKYLIFSSPQNPSGFHFGKDDSDKLLELCRKYDIVLICDEIYRELIYEGQTPGLMGRYDNLFVIGGLSKSHAMSGFRIGWVISPPGFSSSIIKMHQYISTCAGHLPQELAIFALSEPGMGASAEIKAQCQAKLSLATDILTGKLNSENLHLPKAGPYIMLKTRGDSFSKAKELAMKGVICVPGTAFGTRTKKWLRINFAVPDDILYKGLEILIHNLP